MKLTNEIPEIVDLRMVFDVVIITFKQGDTTTKLSFKSKLIKQWKEKAEKWHEFEERNKKAQQFWYVELVEEHQRLKKRIEEYQHQLPLMDEEETKTWCKNQIFELQKILGENIIVGNEGHGMAHKGVEK